MQGVCSIGVPISIHAAKGFVNIAFVVGRPQQCAKGAGIDHDGHRIIGAKVFGQCGQALFDQVQLIGAVHRSRNIDQEHQIGRWPVGGGHIIGAQANADQARVGVPWRNRGVSGDAERLALVRRTRIIIAEVIDKLLRPDSGLWRHLPLIQHAAGLGVAAGIDIDGEGGHRRISGALDS